MFIGFAKLITIQATKEILAGVVMIPHLTVVRKVVGHTLDTSATSCSNMETADTVEHGLGKEIKSSDIHGCRRLGAKLQLITCYML